MEPPNTNNHRLPLTTLMNCFIPQHTCRPLKLFQMITVLSRLHVASSASSGDHATSTTLLLQCKTKDLQTGKCKSAISFHLLLNARLD